MGDTSNNGNDDTRAKTMPFSLPPGCRFYPSDEQLLCYYLTNKNLNADETGNPSGYDMIKELDLYECQPYELPEKACYTYGRGGRKRHWYFYCKVGARNGRKSWEVRNGYWRKEGRVREVVKSNNKGRKVILGRKTSFVFYLRDSTETTVRTDWIMYEYALVHHVKNSFVLCRVFVKSHGGNNLSEIGLSSVAEESVSAVRHIGVQNDGFLMHNIVEAKENDEKHDDRNNDISEMQIKLVSKLDNHASSRPISLPCFQFPAGTPPNKQVGSSGFASGAMFAAAPQFLSILEEDFMELDDLVH
ncbi:NAC domain-containing protein 79-like isoform X2 [Mangifera indica]|uniref:NAC domain-containing protein 79-like isoform X2 n=1 Tax=Mangifera indica TaxID=29780 RepID=UPI001CFB8D3D|nr:NAC domain-containing protein 79-like isoform X2 [Mangifera indica]XP_044475360.1 NAC domain-containing protein 79-like isoform X2 [Mangifera indica]XP_044475361.1 NAC domain-containing protein 79-like isoform X2 [Mangifera indica]XP_044475362.1 NAC domain-containing protein 79-like isoform X2 [Mangifera indica]